MRSSRLQLNASKTEVLWCASAGRQSHTFRSIGCWLWSRVACQKRARSRYFYWRYPDDAYLPTTQATQTCSKCFAAILQLRSIRRSVPNDVMQSLIVALMFSRLDYGSAALAGLPKQIMERLQSVQNAAARLIFKACRQDHIQPLLRRLHWLRMPQRVSFRLAVLVYRCLHGSAPSYLASQRMSHLNARRWLRSSTTSALFAPRTVRSTISAPLQRLLHRSGTVCRSQSGHRRRCKFSAADWKPNFLPRITAMNNKKFELMLTRRTKAYSSSGSVV